MGDKLIVISLGDIPWLFVVLYAGTYFTSATHEFGHYVAARLFKIRTNRLVVGELCVIFAKRYKGTLLVFRIFPLGGGVRLAPQKWSGPRYGVVCMLAAGAVTNLFFGCLFFIGNLWMENLSLGILGIISSLGVVQLFPAFDSDGKLIWNVYRHGRIK